ncbi:MAG: class I SAM-dependent methyltransferase [Rhodoblastus sp.]
MAALVGRKFQENRDTAQHVAQATAWAKARTVPVDAALRAIGLLTVGPAPELPPGMIAEATERAARSKVAMGGPADLRLLYAAARLGGARRMVETGVAYGWSSLALLAASEDRPDSRLVSVDMPYPKMNNEAFVGIVVPERFHARWKLVRKPDRNGLREALQVLGGRIDLCHYDSDKSYQGRRFAYPLLWAALEPGGIFISDDIGDNFGFAEFAAETGAPCAIVESEGKFVGILRKPGARPESQ